MNHKIRTSIIVMTTSILVAAYWTATRPAPLSSPDNHEMIVEATPKQILEYVHSLQSPVVLLNLWASWCEPCKEEFPQILTLREKLAAQGVKVVFVSIDEPRDLPAAAQFLREQHVNFQTFYKGAQPLEFVTALYPRWEGAVPTTLLFNAQLKLLDAWEGDAKQSEFEARILRQLKGT